MSGHSKWSTIKRQKGANDAKRGVMFTKISNAITITTKLSGSGDPESNPRLRLILDQAREANMPKDNIQRAIDRGLGKLPGQILEEVTYEGFGPHKVAYYIETVTDNKTRTLQEIRNLFDRSGGALGGPGSTAYMFDRKGMIKIVSKSQSKEDEMLELIDFGADDVEDLEEESQIKFILYTDPSHLSTISTQLKNSGYQVEESDIIYKPNLYTDIKTKEEASRVLEFTEKIEDLSDVQKVFANFNISDEIDLNS